MKYALRNDTALGLIDEIARAHRPRLVRSRARSSPCGRAATGSAPGATPGGLDRGRAGTSSSFSAKQVGDGDTKVTVRGWDPVAQSPVVGTSTTPDVARGVRRELGRRADVHPGRRPRGHPLAERRDDGRRRDRRPHRTRRGHRQGAVHRAPGPRRPPDGRRGRPVERQLLRPRGHQHLARRQRDHPVRGRRPRPRAAVRPVGDQRTGLQLPAHRARRRDRRQRQGPRRPGPRERLAEHGVGPGHHHLGAGARASAPAPGAARWSCRRSATRCSSGSRTTT